MLMGFGRGSRCDGLLGVVLMQRVWVAFAVMVGLAGCGGNVSPVNTTLANATSVTPSKTGIPLGLATLGNFEFVSVQSTGQIFTYDLSTGVQVQASVYATPCADPSGMVIASIQGASVMAVACYDTGELLTLSVHADGSLTALGKVAGLPSPFPGIALDGTTVFVPLYGVSQGANGAVARVSLAVPNAPSVTGMATLASPVPGGFANPGYAVVSGGNVYVAAGSESGPQDLSSTIQVVNEASMMLVGTPLVVAHSPQHLAVANGVLYATLYDAAGLVAVDVSNPASIKVLDVLTMSATQTCHPIPILLSGSKAYVGCYAEGEVKTVDISKPVLLNVTDSVSGVPAAQNLGTIGNHVIAVSGETGGSVYALQVVPTGMGGKV